MALIALFVGFFLAYANGSNDNFKGVATLFGSGTTNYRRALLWATATTFIGSIAALILAQGLVATFSGKGLVPDAVLMQQSFPSAVALSAAITVILASRLGFPISTTHALTGALVGAGWLASTTGVNLTRLGTHFLLPLLISPGLAILLASAVYPMFRFGREKFGITRESCLCIGQEELQPALSINNASAMATLPAMAAFPALTLGSTTSCQQRYTGSIVGIRAQALLDSAHWLSAAIVSFARGLNDTPKIAALLLVVGAMRPSLTIGFVAIGIALGGLLNARKVATTLAHRVTAMNAGQGFTANLATGLIVIFASRLGLPVSTTHVSCGALFGIGTITRQAHWKTIATILLAWVTTLPLAALFGAGTFFILERFRL